MRGIAPHTTRGKILLVAAQLMAEHGYDRTTHKQIAELIGTSAPAIYYHFPAKRDIFDALVHLLIENLMAYRPLEDEMSRIIRDGTLMDVLSKLLFNFPEDDTRVMIQLLRIFLMSCFTMPEMTTLYQTYFVTGQRNYIEAVLREMILIGKLSGFDVRGMAAAINDVINYRAMRACMYNSISEYMKYRIQYADEDVMSFRFTVHDWLTNGTYVPIGLGQMDCRAV